MKSSQTQAQSHGRHPVRNFFYFFYTLLNAAAFCTLFSALEKGDVPLAVGAGALVAVAVLLGIVNAVLPKR